MKYRYINFLMVIIFFNSCSNPLSYKVSKDKRYIKSYEFIGYIASNQDKKAWEEISLTTKMVLSYDSLKNNIRQLRMDGYTDINNVQPMNYYYGYFNANSNYYKYTFGLKGEDKSNNFHLFTLVMGINSYDVIEVIGYEYKVNDSLYFQTKSISNNLSEPSESGQIK